MVGMGCCRCCTTTGACCNDGVCTEETCADCEDAGGVFQGVGTECSGEDSDECPCDPPADPSLCEKCDDGSAVSYCPEERPNCCDGTCQAEECGGGGTPCTPANEDDVCVYNSASCSGGGEGCEVDGVTVRLFPNTAQGLADALDYLNTLDGELCAACSVDPVAGKCCDDVCYPDEGDLPGFYTLPIACP